VRRGRDRDNLLRLLPYVQSTDPGRRIVFLQKLFSEVPELVGAKSAAYLLLIGGARGSSTNSSIDG